jgi:hypothetical protein
MTDERPGPRPTGSTPGAPALPSGDPTRDQLLVRWREARRRRHAAALGTDAFREACDDIARIEVEIARVERAMDPPRV